MVQSTVTLEMFVVFSLIAIAMFFFVTELISPDTTAVAIIVTVVVLQPWTKISPHEAISGFANPATVTIIGMFILSAGLQRTGVVQRLEAAIERFAQGSTVRILATIVGVTGPLAGFVNNTPIVAVLIPLVTDLADHHQVSPSKLLIPLSYAAMMGGTLTLVGTSTNLVASDLSRELLNHPFSMFEITPLGIIVLVVGSLYLLTIGQWLLPERLYVADLTEEFGLGEYLSRVSVPAGSPIVGQTVVNVFGELNFDVDILQIIRDGEVFVVPGSQQELKEGDVLVLRGSGDALQEFTAETGVERHEDIPVTEDDLGLTRGQGTIVEVVIPPESGLSGDTIATAKLRERYTATALAIRHGDEVIRDDLTDVVLESGDALLLHITFDGIEHLHETGDCIITEEAQTSPRIRRSWEIPDEEIETAISFDRSKAPLAIGIMGGVVGVAALGLMPIVITALAGVVLMLITDILRPFEAYRAVGWNVIFLLAGMIPLGLALQQTGGAALLAAHIIAMADVFPVIVLLVLLYLLTSVLASTITPVATVVLMLPIAIDTANGIGANAFAFVLAVTFAANAAFMTPVGYQTNLMVYSSGGYRFTDYVRIGMPLQALLAVVTPLGIALIWGV